MTMSYNMTIGVVSGPRPQTRFLKLDLVKHKGKILIIMKIAKERPWATSQWWRQDHEQQQRDDHKDETTRSTSMTNTKTRLWEHEDHKGKTFSSMTMTKASQWALQGSQREDR